MAARATRSAGRGSASSSSDDASRCLLLVLSHDELGVIVDGLADPLQPVVAVALSSTCLGLWTPLRAALAALAQLHARARLLCEKLSTRVRMMSYRILRDLERLDVSTDRGRTFTNDNMVTLGMLLTNWLPRLRELKISYHYAKGPFLTLCEGLGRGAAPSLLELSFTGCKLSPAIAEALAFALCTGALPKLETLGLGDNCFGNRGVTALALPVRKLPALKSLNLWQCDIGDEGMAALMADLGKDDFKALEKLHIQFNDEVTGNGIATLIPALKAGAMPALEYVLLPGIRPADRERQRAIVKQAIEVRPSLKMNCFSLDDFD